MLEYPESHARRHGFHARILFRNDPARYTLKWFAWADTLFGELILQVLDVHPGLLAR